MLHLGCNQLQVSTSRNCQSLEHLAGSRDGTILNVIVEKHYSVRQYRMVSLEIMLNNNARNTIISALSCKSLSRLYVSSVQLSSSAKTILFIGWWCTWCSTLNHGCGCRSIITRILAVTMILNRKVSPPATSQGSQEVRLRIDKPCKK